MSRRDPLAAFRAAPDWIWRAIIFLLALGVLLLITTRWRSWETNAKHQSTDDAYLQSDLTPIAAHVAGYIRDMPVQDFERVHKGQLIAQLVDEHAERRFDHSATLWLLLVFEGFLAGEAGVRAEPAVAAATG